MRHILTLIIVMMLEGFIYARKPVEVRNPFCYAQHKVSMQKKENMNAINDSTWQHVQTIQTTTGTLTLLHDADGNQRTVQLSVRK